MATTKTPREECYHALRNEFASGIAAHFRKHPNELQDPMLETNIKSLMVIMLNVIKLLDKYEISTRDRHSRKDDK